MGTEIPPEWPEILDDKWYVIDTDMFTGEEPETTSCASPFTQSFKCVYRGDFFKAKMAAGHECNGTHSFCSPGMLDTECEKITNITGPFDSEQEAEDYINA